MPSFYTVRSVGPERSRQSSQRNKTSTLLPQSRQKSVLLRLAPAPFALCALLRPLFRGRTAARDFHRLWARSAGRGRALASSRLSRRSRPSARNSSGGRQAAEAGQAESRSLQRVTPRGRQSPNRLGLNVQQVLELAWPRCLPRSGGQRQQKYSRPEAVAALW